jgi:hypothetical protein
MLKVVILLLQSHKNVTISNGISVSNQVKRTSGWLKKQTPADQLEAAQAPINTVDVPNVEGENFLGSTPGWTFMILSYCCISKPIKFPSLLICCVLKIDEQEPLSLSQNCKVNYIPMSCYVMKFHVWICGIGQATPCFVNKIAYPDVARYWSLWVFVFGCNILRV